MNCIADLQVFNNLSRHLSLLFRQSTPCERATRIDVIVVVSIPIPAAYLF